MKVSVTSIPVLDQDKALTFYTETLGFVKKVDIPLSEHSRWLTVVSREDPEGIEILLEPAPNHFEPASSANVQRDYDRLKSAGVEFSVAPTEFGTVKIAVFNDTCGNHIQLVEML